MSAPVIRQHSSEIGIAKQRGQSLTEFALVLPLLVLVMMGALDLGRLYYAYVAIENASREGAREASLNPNDVSSLIEARTIQEATNSGVTLTSSSVSTTCYVTTGSTTESCSSAALGDTIRVRVNYTFQLVSAYLFGGSFPISTYTDMVIMRIQ